MRRLALLLVVVALTSGRMTAQSRPDFSGTWKGPDGTIAITQDATTLIVRTEAEIRTYNLDGSPSRFEGASSNRYRSQKTAQARWVGSALVVAVTTVSPIGTWQDLEVYSLDHGPTLSVVSIGTRETSPMMFTSVKSYAR